MSYICIVINQETVAVMKARVGQFHFCRHRGSWGIFQYTLVSETGTHSSHISNCFNFESALKETYRLNGWGEPKNYTQRF